MTNPSPYNIQLRHWILEYLLSGAGSAEFQAAVLAALNGILTTRGDMLRRGAANAERFAKGAQNTLLVAGANDPNWATLSALLDAVIGNTRGQALVRGQSAWVARTPTGAGQALRFDGTDTDFGAVGDLQSDYFQSNANTAVTQVIAIDGSIPQDTEGFQFWTEEITPVSASSVLEFEVGLNGIASGGNPFVTIALFTDASANAVAASVQFAQNTTFVQPRLSFRMASWGTTARDVSVRVGVSLQTFTLNGVDTVTDLGGVMHSYAKWREYLP